MLNIIQKPVAPKNFQSGRHGYTPVAIVVHIEDGSESGTDSWFNDPKAHVSSHYSVAKTGEIHQYVKDLDTAYHAGTVVNPSFKLIAAGGKYHGVDPNKFTLGIEHEGRSGDGLTPDQFEASAELIATLAHRFNISLDSDHIIPHHAIRENKTCPGSGVDMEALIKRATFYSAQVS